MFVTIHIFIGFTYMWAYIISLTSNFPFDSFVLFCSKRKREKKIGGIGSTELVDNVLYEANLPLDHQNSNNAGRLKSII